MGYLWMILLLGLLVIFHEFGHMWVAQRCGVKVETFGIGLPFGPTLWKVRYKDVDWVFHALPLGGYVAFADDNEDSSLPDDSPQRFKNQPWWNRLAITMAGIAANVIIAVVLMVSVLMAFGTTKTELLLTGFQPRLEVLAPATAAAVEAMPLALYDAHEHRIPTEQGFWATELATQDWQQQQPNSQLVLKNTATGKVVARLHYAQEANAALPLGATIASVNGQLIEGYMGQTQGILKHALEPYKGKTASLELYPMDGEGPVSVEVEVNKEGQLGVLLAANQSPTPPLSFMDATRIGLTQLYLICQQNFEAFGKIFSGKLALNQVDGPIGIVTFGGNVIDSGGLDKGLVLTAMISMLLAVMNLLPIPPLDGSYLIFIGYEAITGKPFPERFKNILNQSFFYLLIGFMLLILGNDIFKLVWRLLGWA